MVDPVRAQAGGAEHLRVDHQSVNDPSVLAVATDDWCGGRIILFVKSNSGFDNHKDVVTGFPDMLNRGVDLWGLSQSLVNGSFQPLSVIFQLVIRHCKANLHSANISVGASFAWQPKHNIKLQPNVK